MRPSQTAPRPIPAHDIAPKDIRHRREGDTPVTPIERLLDLLSPRAAIRQDKRGSQRENLLGGLELKPPQDHPLFARARAVGEGISSADRLRKQFGVLCAHLRQILAVLHHVFPTSLILRFSLERYADLLAPTGWGLLLHLCVFHHSTVWRISALPSPLFFSLSG